MDYLLQNTTESPEIAWLLQEIFKHKILHIMLDQHPTSEIHLFKYPDKSNRAAL